MATLTVGKQVRYTDPPQIMPPGTGATTLQRYQPPTSLVPANAVRAFYRIDLYRAEADSNGNMDSFVVIRYPSDQTHNAHSFGIAGDMAAGHSGPAFKPNSGFEIGGIPFEIINDSSDANAWYWMMQGNALNNTNWAVTLLGYEAP